RRAAFRATQLMVPIHGQRNLPMDIHLPGTRSQGCLVAATPAGLFALAVGHCGFNKGWRPGGSVLALRRCDASQFFDAAFEQSVLLAKLAVLASKFRNVVILAGKLFAQSVALELQKVSMSLIHPCDSARIAVHGDITLDALLPHSCAPA